MKKTYKMFLTLMLCMLGVGSVSAEELSLQEVPFCSWDGWGADAMSTGTADCAWVVGEATGQPYGDSSVNNYADLSTYSKLVIVASDGTPRIMLNRDVAEGQYNANEAESHLIEYPKCASDWAGKYFTTSAGEEAGQTVYTVDLKAIAKDKGFAHLHAIKGANWANVTVYSMTVIREAKAPQGWTSIITNGDFESDDISSFVLSKEANGSDGGVTYPIEINDTCGRMGGRGLLVETMANAYEEWSTQLFVKLGEPVTEGLKWRFSMDVKADNPATVNSGSHAAPRSWIGGGIIPEFEVTDEWQTITADGEISADLASKEFGSIAFDLNKDKVNANKFYFDNIKFEVFKLGTVAEWYQDFINIDFGFDTNIGELASANVEKRVFFPIDCVTVKINGQSIEEAGNAIESVEGFADGRFYIFLEQMLNDDDEVYVTFTNPADPAFHLVYASGAVAGQDVKDYDGEATLNGDIAADDAYSYLYVTPTLVASNPENGAFNLKNDIREFSLTFDKNVDCATMEATLNGTALTINPIDAVEGFAKNIVLTRAEQGDLATGEYTLHLTKIYGERMLDESVFGDTTLVINVGKIEYDPNDQPYDVIPVSYFESCAVNGIPEGFLLVADNDEQRTPGSSYGSGARMMEFAAGGEFTRGLYMRTNYLEYGNNDDAHYLNMEAGKRYQITFNSCMWKSSGQWMKFQILDLEENEIFSQMVENKPNLDGKRDAVNGSTATKIYFTPETTAQYLMRWVLAKNADGTPTGNDWAEVILANVLVKYAPNRVGYDETQLLNTALENAKKASAENGAERYDGVALDALNAAIAKYDAEKEDYTNPSQYTNAAAELDELAQAQKDHRLLCDDYDKTIKQSIDVERQNREKKFNTTEIYAQICGLNAKYNAISEWRNVADTITNPGAEQWELFYSYDVLKTTDSLTVAVAELKAIANTASLLFTEGESKTSDTGVKVLVERLRLGAKTLEALGVPATDALIAEANSTLIDDDQLADAIKNRIKAIVYDSLRTPGNNFFAPTLNELYEDVPTTYDMTVFVKNPNVYKLSDDINYSAEAVPGWITPEGFNKPGLSCGWGATRGTSEIAEDCMFQTWGGSYRAEQTITDLPVGVYTIQMGFGERNDEASLPGSFVYAKTSETIPAAEGQDETFAATADARVIGQSFPYASSENMPTLEGVVVIDGELTIGVNGGPSSHTFFNDVRLLMTAAIDNTDYASLYEEVANGIDETVARPTTVRAIQLFDLNGRRVTTARPGIVIVKKLMSNGTVITEKVVKK